MSETSSGCHHNKGKQEQKSSLFFNSLVSCVLGSLFFNSLINYALSDTITGRKLESRVVTD